MRGSFFFHWNGGIVTSVGPEGCFIARQADIFLHVLGNSLEVDISPKGVGLIHLPGTSTTLIFNNHASQRLFHFEANSLIIDFCRTTGLPIDPIISIFLYVEQHVCNSTFVSHNVCST